MDKRFIYEIRVEGHLTDRWSDWFDGLAVRNSSNNETTISGLLPDQSALISLLTRLHALNLVLISVARVAE